MSVKIDPTEFRLMRDYIEQQCGIHVGDEKMYLVETRLTTLMAEQGCSDFRELHRKALSDSSNKLRDKIVDAMTTNETLWFRDSAPFTILRSVLKEMAEDLNAGKRREIRIWCAACSTGQEPYSIAMLAKELERQNSKFPPATVKILATDISPTALFLAMSGRYDSFAISRGLSEEYKSRYFSFDGKVWTIDNKIKSMVTFKKLNLQDRFDNLGKQDIVFCRNVLIYFSDDFKRDILQKIHDMLSPGGLLFVGASESLMNYSKGYRMIREGRGIYYRKE
ncbi:MAG: chemotaxis protein [Chitinivibrionales bacterium]|nr:chemotaxis protein [Chitinivibrionales bacterium]